MELEGQYGVAQKGAWMNSTFVDAATGGTIPGTYTGMVFSGLLIPMGSALNPVRIWLRMESVVLVVTVDVIYL